MTNNETGTDFRIRNVNIRAIRVFQHLTELFHEQGMIQMNLQGQCGTRHTDWSKIDIREDGNTPPPRTNAICSVPKDRSLQHIFIKVHLISCKWSGVSI